MIQSLCACTTHSLLRYLRTDWINWAFVSAMKTEKLKSIFSSCFSARGFGHVLLLLFFFLRMVFLLASLFLKSNFYREWKWLLLYFCVVVYFQQCHRRLTVEIVCCCFCVCIVCRLIGHHQSRVNTQTRAREERRCLSAVYWGIFRRGVCREHSLTRNKGHFT